MKHRARKGIGDHWWKFSHRPLTPVSQRPVCVSRRDLLFSLLSLGWRGEGGLQGKQWLRPKAGSLLRAWNIICLHLLHPSRLLTFTPDPVTPSSGLQQQQKQEIREIDRLEGITVALFISGCAHSWHSLLAVLQLNLIVVYFFSLSTDVWTWTKL